jgi:hypothetical protein
MMGIFGNGQDAASAVKNKARIIVSAIAVFVSSSLSFHHFSRELCSIAIAVSARRYSPDLLAAAFRRPSSATEVSSQNSGGL